MCGRYVLKSSPQRLREVFGIEGPDTAHSETWRPRYNLAPQQDAPVVRCLEGQRRLDLLRWGLLPAWAKDPALGNRLINARSETVADKPAFRSAFKSRRCIVPADGFYEWQQQPAGKQPFYIHRQDGELLAMGGLWEQWTSPSGEQVPTFSILTMAANAWMQPLHERMPVILEGDALDAWLDPATQPSQLQALFRPLPLDVLTAYPVTRAMGNVRHDRPDNLDPLPPPPVP